MTETRTAIADCIADAPGIHFSALVRRLDLAPGQVQYHLRKLRSSDRVVAEELYGRTHYFAPSFAEDERLAIAVLRRETAREIVAALFESGPSKPAAVADDLAIARSTLEYHLDRLVDADLVRKRRDDGGRVTLALARPAETVELLAAVDPTVSERMVDRFTRLLDSLLDG
jgi:predicted transcriptional regulator